MLWYERVMEGHQMHKLCNPKAEIYSENVNHELKGQGYL